MRRDGFEPLAVSGLAMRRLRQLERMRRRNNRQLAVAIACLLAAALLAVLLVRTAAADEGGARDLARLARRWQPLWRGSDAELVAVAGAIVRGCADNPWPDAERCQAQLLALAFRESSWRVGATGARGEVGLLQLHGRALAGRSLEEAREPATNVRLALEWLHVATRACERAGWRRSRLVERSLSNYAGLGCARSRGARMVMRWAAQIESEAAGRAAQF